MLLLFLGPRSPTLKVFQLGGVLSLHELELAHGHYLSPSELAGVHGPVVKLERDLLPGQVEFALVLPEHHVFLLGPQLVLAAMGGMQRVQRLRSGCRPTVDCWMVVLDLLLASLCLCLQIGLMLLLSIT